MKEITIKTNQYRIREMNAIEMLALKSQGDFSNFDGSLRTLKCILENLEVKVLDKWLPVKQKNMEVYYPKGIENDFEVLPQLIEFFSKYMTEVFPKSNKLKEEIE